MVIVDTSNIKCTPCDITYEVTIRNVYGENPEQVADLVKSRFCDNTNNMTSKYELHNLFNITKQPTPQPSFSLLDRILGLPYAIDTKKTDMDKGLYDVILTITIRNVPYTKKTHPFESVAGYIMNDQSSKIIKVSQH